jgi:ornithine cyclodeaminase/alanine dehydrogenase-like protein (mu-crystallin family)
MPLILKNDEVKTILETISQDEFEHIIPELFHALHTMCLAPHLVHQPPRTVLPSNLPITTTKTLIMVSSYTLTTAVKTITLPPPNSTLTLQSSVNGDLIAVIGANELTAFRTALASLILVRLRKLKLEKVVIFGCGKQAEWLYRLLRYANDGPVRIYLIGRGLVCPTWAFHEPLIRYATHSCAEAWHSQLKTSDAIFCCTPSTQPLFSTTLLGDLIGGKRELYISLIGSYQPDMVEVEPSLLIQPGVKVVVDNIEACFKEAGEIIQSGIKPEEVEEIGSVTKEIVQGMCIFKCVGLGIMDLVAGRELVTIARKRCVGVEIDGF